MKSIEIIELGRRPTIHTQDRILDALLGEQVDVLMACGGRGRCATCHVHVEHGQGALSEMTDREIRTLNRISARRDNSRLACQARVLGEGVRVSLPNGEYLTDQTNLEDLIGKRTERAILHPLDGRVLVDSGQLITRYMLMELEEVDLQPEELAEGARDISARERRRARSSFLDS